MKTLTIMCRLPTPAQPLKQVYCITILGLYTVIPDNLTLLSATTQGMFIWRQSELFALLGQIKVNCLIYGTELLFVA